LSSKRLRENKETVYIRAEIYTERPSQKAILIGKNGSLLKEIGRLAREEIERLLGNKVYLDLWVKVKEDWRNRDFLLRQFGYREEE
jgi:GTP-binding protein Era